LQSPLVVFDVGNSRLKAGLFDRADTASLPNYLACHSQDVRQPLETNVLLQWTKEIADPVPAIVTGSSPGGVETLMLDWSLSTIQTPVPLRDRNLLSIPMDVKFPEKVGIDRLLNAMAADRLRDEGEAALIVDSGTATTVDLLDAEGVFRGGAILPGLRLSAESLHHYTQLLPKIPLEELQHESHGPVGRETREAIRSGLYWGQLGAIRELTTRITSDCDRVQRFLTGGGAELLTSELPEFQFVSHLSLRGFALLADQIL